MNETFAEHGVHDIYFRFNVIFTRITDDPCRSSFHFVPRLSDGRTCYGLSNPTNADSDLNMCEVSSEDENRREVKVEDSFEAERLATFLG